MGFPKAEAGGSFTGPFSRLTEVAYRVILPRPPEALKPPAFKYTILSIYAITQKHRKANSTDAMGTYTLGSSDVKDLAVSVVNDPLAGSAIPQQDMATVSWTNDNTHVTYSYHNGDQGTVQTTVHPGPDEWNIPDSLKSAEKKSRRPMHAEDDMRVRAIIESAFPLPLKVAPREPDRIWPLPSQKAA